MSAYRYNFGAPVNITTATTTVVKKGEGALYCLIVNKAVANGVYTIYDGIDNTGTKIATVTQPGTLLASQVVLPYFCTFKVGLTIVTSSTDDITVTYQ